MSFQISAGLLDACVLAIVEKKDTYGYEITQEMKKRINISESTLYPVLRRLQKNGYLGIYDQPYQGRNRRYYAITELGKKQLAGYRKEWSLYKDCIDGIIEKGMENK